MTEQALLTIKQLSIQFKVYGGTVHAVRQLDLQLGRGETLAIVGESGCGKSVTCQAIMGLVQKPAGHISQGEIIFAGQDILKLSRREQAKLRGSRIAMIFQDPMTALNPTLSIGVQLTEGVRKHQGLDKASAYAKAEKMLSLVGIANPEERLHQYPHQLSGGLRQRVVIAMALMCDPELLIADEPTTALDVTIQAQVLELFERIQAETGVAIILITHDLGVVAKIADRIAVMYAGQCIETGNRQEIFYQPKHPYTQGLLASVPRLDMARDSLLPIEGQPPDLFAPPSYCSFYQRCKQALEVCHHLAPEPYTLSDSRRVACWLQDERVQLS